jgi:hypothetical protein
MNESDHRRLWRCLAEAVCEPRSVTDLQIEES